jgi:hypothetical protein
MKNALTVMVIGVVIAIYSGAAIAQDENDWEFDLAPLYLWAINIDGDLGVRDQTTSLNIEFSDIWDNLEGVFTVRFNAVYRKKFGLFLDYNYLDLGTEKQRNVVNTDIGFKSQIFHLGGSYRFMDGRQVLEGLAGIRYIDLEAEVNFNTIGRSINRDQDWVDPVVGLRYGFHMTDQWTLRLYGDIGGFGAGSDFSWQGVALVDFQPWRYVAIVGGYRAIGADYETGSGIDLFTYDAVVHGPLIGIDIRF